MIENGISKCIMQEIEKEFIMRDKQDDETAVPRVEGNKYQIRITRPEKQ